MTAGQRGGWSREHEREEMGWECCTMRSGIMGKTDRNLPFWFSTPIPHRPTLYPYISPHLLFASKKVQSDFNFFLSYYFLLSTFDNFISGRFSFTPSNNTTFSKPATTPLLTFPFFSFFFFFFESHHCLLPPTELCWFPCQWSHCWLFAERLTAHKSWECVGNFWSNSLWQCFLLPPV